MDIKKFALKHFAFTSKELNLLNATVSWIYEHYDLDGKSDSAIMAIIDSEMGKMIENEVIYG